MIKNFNEWYIDVNLAPQEGQIEKRLECIADYAKSVDANDICNLVNLYYWLTTDKEDLESFASVFIETDPSFSSRYTKELSLLAGATLLEISTEKRNLEQVFVKLVNQKAKHSSLEDLLQEMDDEAAQEPAAQPAEDKPAADAPAEDAAGTDGKKED